MRPEGPPGSEPKAAEEEVEPVILVNLPQPYPRVQHAGTTISGGRGWGAGGEPIRPLRWNDIRLVGKRFEKQCIFMTRSCVTSQVCEGH